MPPATVEARDLAAARPGVQAPGGTDREAP
jgi:hypothetical protein